MTLTSAPELTTLADLGHEWRHVGYNPGFGDVLIWHGDLSDRYVYKRFRFMVEKDMLILVQHRTAHGSNIFAKMAKTLNPHTTHAEVIGQMLRAARIKEADQARAHRGRRKAARAEVASADG